MHCTGWLVKGKQLNSKNRTQAWILWPNYSSALMVEQQHHNTSPNTQFGVFSKVRVKNRIIYKTWVSITYRQLKMHWIHFSVVKWKLTSSCTVRHHQFVMFHSFPVFWGMPTLSGIYMCGEYTVIMIMLRLSARGRECTVTCVQ